MIRTTLFPGRYVQGVGAMARLGQELHRFGPRAFVVCDPYILDNVFPPFQSDIASAVQLQVEKFGGECSDEEIARLSAAARAFEADSITGIGGGKTLDTAKAVGFDLKIPAASVPTAASTDAPTSALSVIYTPGGQFERYLFLPTNPALVLVDTQVVATAPIRFLVSGMGDALATWFEAYSCRQAFSGNMTGDLGSYTAYELARLCYETLLEYGAMAKQAAEHGAITPAVERIVEANTLLSGLGFESGGLAAAHAIHNGFTVLPATHPAMHGEKVAIGTQTGLFLTDQPLELIDEVYDFCEEVGLPTTLEEIGLPSQVPDEDLWKVAEAACAEGDTMHNEPRPVTPADVVAALKAADAEGKARR
jgi:glycerol dehydrogenase